MKGRVASPLGAAFVAASSSALALATFDDGAALSTRLLTVALAAAAFAAGWLRPESATLALTAVATVLPALPRYLSDPKGGPALLAIACAGFGAALARRLANGEPSPLPPSLLRCAFAFLAVAAASAASSILRGETLYLLLRGGADPLFVNGLWMSADDRNREAVRALLASGLLLAAFDALSRVPRERLLPALVWAAALGAGVSALEPLLPVTLTFAPWTHISRASGSFSDPNALGVGLALLVPLLAAFLATRGGAGRALALGILAASLVALNASGSRSGLLLLLAAAGLAGLGLFRARPRLRPALLAAVALLLLSALVVWRFGPRGRSTSAGRLLERLGSAFSAAGVSDLATHRPIFWGTAFQVIEEEPLSGCGLGAFPFEFPLRYEKRKSPITVTDNATNALLDLAAEAGLPALLLALAAAIPLLVRALDAALGAGGSPLVRAAGAALAGLAVASLTGSHLRYPEVAILAAAVAALVPAPEPDPTADAAPAPRRAVAVLAISGIVASCLVVLPTRKAAATFRTGVWVGVYGWELNEKAGTAQRWMGPRAFRRLGAKEEKITLVMINERPDGRPVLVTADAEGRPVLSHTLPPGVQQRLTVTPPPGAEALRFRFDPTFIPFRVTGRRDFRELSVRLAWDSGEPH